MWMTEELTLLKESAERFVEKEYGFERRRELAAGEAGFDRALWARFAELGWLAAPLPEDCGGLGGSILEVAVLMEALGRGLVVEPYLSTVVLGAGLVARAGSDAQRRALLPAVAEGRMLLAFAQAEPQSRYDLADVETTARKDGAGFRLSGRKCLVFHGASADRIVVSARTSGDRRARDGIGLFLVDPARAGATLRGHATVDGLRAAELTLEDVPVGAEDCLGDPGGGLAAIEQVVDAACVALAAEAVGIMDAMIVQTRDYLKTREQFGQPIGAFQVPQHMVVDMFTACELSRALTLRAAATLADDDSPDGAQAASAAKMQTGRAGRLVGQSAIQLHGGMGMTEELAIGHYFKRLAMIGQTFGDADFHLSRFAAG